MEVEKERGEKRASSNKDVAEIAKERAYMAAKARHENYVGHRTAHKARIGELQQTHAQYARQMAQRENEVVRASSAKERDLKHQINVLKGHVQRGQASSSTATTIAYPAHSAAAASTVAYPAHAAAASSKTSGTEAAVSVSRSRTRHSQSPDVMKAFESHGRRRSPDLSHVRPGLPFA
jgi:hypothetical protein